MMENAPGECIICGSKEKRLLLKQGQWEIYACNPCGFGFLDPRPSREELSSLYGPKYFKEHYDMGLDPGSPEFRKMLSLKTSHIRFFRNIKPRGRILDVGCGNGYFLAACREKGYDVQGLDVSNLAVRYNTETLGISTILGDLENVELPAKCFDIITMWHFLEHAPDPRTAIEKAKSWLKADGILVVDVPNYQGTDARKRGENWEGWQAPHHLWHFTRHTLAKLLQTHDFAVIRTKTYHSEVIKETLGIVPFLKPFARLIAKMFSGTSVAVASRINIR